MAARMAREAAVPFHRDWSNVGGRKNLTHTSWTGWEGATEG